jgi:hypothetical protein
MLRTMNFEPSTAFLVGLGGVEPPTPALSAQCSNQLSYRPTGILFMVHGVWFIVQTIAINTVNNYHEPILQSFFLK